MHDNPQAPSDRAFALDDHAVIEFAGADAVAFAQAQFMSDLTAIAAGQWQWSGWLTPKGRVVALFMLLRLADDRLWLVLPDADAGTFAAALSRFVFRSKVKVAVRSELRVAGTLASDRPGDARIVGEPGGVVAIDRSDVDQPRTLLVSSEHSDADADGATQWRAADLLAGIPRLEASQREQWTPQQLSLERLQAFSVKKGCYPGQEIVARTHFLGKAKRGLLLVEADAPLQAGGALVAGDAGVGTVIATASHPERHLGLAVATLERDAALPLSVDGAPVAERPLRRPLAP